MGAACAGQADADQSGSPAGLGMNNRSGGCDTYERRPPLLLLGDIAPVYRDDKRDTHEKDDDKSK